MYRLILFYYKWIRKQCPHFCYLCSHKDYCYDEYGADGLIKDFKKQCERKKIN